MVDQHFLVVTTIITLTTATSKTINETHLTARNSNQISSKSSVLEKEGHTEQYMKW